MKRTKKRILGFLGLFLVAAVTTFAILMPAAQTSAVHGPSTVDTVQVRVVGAVPLVTFTEPESGVTFDTPEHRFSYDYENLTSGKVEVEYTDMKGVTHTYILDEWTADYEASSRSFTLNFDSDPRFGYGTYKMRATGNGFGAENVSEDVIEFSYNVFDPSFPGGDNNGVVTGPGESEDNPMTENPEIHFGINPDNPYIKYVEVNVYDEDGNIVEELSPQTVESPFEDLELQFQDHGLPSGWYTVKIQAYDNDDNPYGEPKTLKFYYKAPELPVPDTGAAFMDLNISKQDYLITGLVIFGLTAAAGAVFVVRKKATAKRKK